MRFRLTYSALKIFRSALRPPTGQRYLNRAYIEGAGNGKHTRVLAVHVSVYALPCLGVVSLHKFSMSQSFLFCRNNRSLSRLKGLGVAALLPFISCSAAKHLPKCQPDLNHCPLPR